MSDHDALLKAILDEPEDDLVRLAYADWLEEHGSESEQFRAEMIRGTWDASGPSRFATTFPELSRFERGINTYVESAEAPAIVIDGYWHWGSEGSRSRLILERGFLREVRCHVKVWTDWAGTFADLHPIRRVEVVDRSPEPYFGTGEWCWVRKEDDTPGRCFLSPSVYDLLHDGSLRFDPPRPNAPRSYPGSYKVYRSRELAQDALSDALLRHARLT